MSDTANLNLPCLEPAQAQKHVTLNEALTALDALVQLSVKGAGLALNSSPTALCCRAASRPATMLEAPCR